MARVTQARVEYDKSQNPSEQISDLSGSIEAQLQQYADVINRNANSADWVATEPAAAASLAGRMIVVEDGAGGGAGSETDQLKICMRNGGSWTWRIVTVT